MVKVRKRFGQHFLTDATVLARIVARIGLKRADRLLEIGPGLGALTEYLYGTTKRFVAIEIDRDLAPPLRARFPDLELIVADVLQFNFTELDRADDSDKHRDEGNNDSGNDRNDGKHKDNRDDLRSDADPDRGNERVIGTDDTNIAQDKGADKHRGNGAWRLVGNLPYNISTPLLVRLLRSSLPIADMHFMLQKELAERVNATPGTKNWGRLSVLVQHRCSVEQLFDVGPSSFVPPPKVWSSVVRLTPRAETLPLPNPDNFDAVLRTAFSARRKRIDNALRKLPIDWQRTSVDRQARPDQLSVADYVYIANALTSDCAGSDTCGTATGRDGGVVSALTGRARSASFPKGA